MAEEQNTVKKEPQYIISSPETKQLSPKRKSLGLSLAILSDFLLEVVPSPWGQLIDAVTGLLLFLLLGHRWELLPALVAEMIPGVSCFPTWTAVVIYINIKDKSE